MSSYEFSGKTVREAIARACEELNVDEALLDVEVLEESTRGFLGIVGQRDARVRVRKRDILREVMEAEEPLPKTPAPSSPEEPAVAPPQPEPIPGPTLTEATDEEEVENDFVEEPEEQSAARVGGGDPAAHLEEAAGVLREILRLMEVEAEVEASIVSGAAFLDIKSDGSGLLIGKKGQTLDALQAVVSKIINKNAPLQEKIEIVVDTENYRSRKRESLREMALRMSERAKKTLKPVSFNPMTAQERRVVHLILAEDREVFTKSYGEGSMRRIIVYPRRGSAGKRRRR
jgi:spoIIIJ-associated protein